MTGIKETKEVVAFFVKIAEGVKVALADGKFEIGDIVHFSQVILLIQPALADVSSVPAELKDLTVAEGMELLADVTKGLEPKPAAVVSAVVKFILSGMEVYQAIKA